LRFKPQLGDTVTGSRFILLDNVKSNPNGSVWVEDSLNEGRIFSGRLTYDKGAAIIHTFRFMMNDDAAFFQALKNIQLAFEHDVANGLDIRDYFEAASGVDFDNALMSGILAKGFLHILLDGM